MTNAERTASANQQRQTTIWNAPWVAVPFGEDGTDGDSCFYAGWQDALIYQGESFPTMRDRFITDKEIAEWGDGPVPPRDSDDYADVLDEMNELAGFWIVPGSVVRQIDDMWDDLDPGNDSASYNANRACKRMAERRAVLTLISDMGEQTLPS